MVCPRCTKSFLMCKCWVTKDEGGKLIALTIKQKKELKKTGKVTTKTEICPKKGEQT